MKSGPDLRALAELFEEACALNREALAALEAGTPLHALSGLFGRKQGLAESLEKEWSGSASQARGSNADLERVLRSQKEAALLETRLSEALGNAVPRSGKALAAYKKNTLGARSEGLDHSR
ncbi:MAG TPA: hypothetical protein VK914_05245 [bacterium]|jgi:hypothetical protein|nr:hypothetical protein [bacterium]